MPYVIDGHNLIGTGLLPGISLEDEDDEERLVRLLKQFQPRVRTRITVVFDRGLPGGRSRVLSGGNVEVVFASATGQTADAVIKARIHKARHPESLRVVSDDVEVQTAARRHRCRVVSARDFARELARPLPRTPKRENVHLSSDEIEAWLQLFRQGKDPGHKS